MSGWRINLFLLFIVLFGLAIIGRLFYLQIINHDFYSALAQGQQKFFSSSVPERGEIFLKKKIPLAVNRVWKFCVVSSREIKDKEKTAQILASVLDLEKNSLLEKIKNEQNLFLVIKRKLTEKEIEDLKKLKLKGVYLKEEKLREYPQGKFLSQVIGFVGGEGRGQYGLEEYWEKDLKGETGRGSDLFLTIDYNIQYQAEKLLQAAKDKLDAEGGQIIVMDPHSGEIIALANFPNFDPNQYSKESNLEIFLNGAIQKIFEPGSIFKPIVMAAALEEQKITPYTTYIDRGFVKIGPHTIYNYDYKIWGEQTMTQVLENSINTGAVFVERKLGHDLYLKYLEKFGIFEPTGIDLAGEIFSQNKEFKKGYEINFATASFGQGIEMTPIQLVRAIAVIANGGKLVKPYIVEKIKKNDKIIEIQPEIIKDNIISSKTASQLTAMLVSSVERGYAKRAKIPGYYIAGKTGTAQVPFSALGIKKRGYSEKAIHSFVGYGPAFNPKFLILVKLDNPKVRAAEFSTTLLARALMKYIIDYYQIPPDYDIID